MAKQIPFPDGILHQTHATIRNAFEKARSMAIAEGYMGNINITHILTRLIQETGRFVEAYASDLLYDIDYIRTLCENTYPLEAPIDEIYTIGLRKSGVDHGNFVMSQLTTQNPGNSAYLCPERVYRKILAVHVIVTPARNESGPSISCSLKDITGSLYKLDAADLDENGNVIYAPFTQKGEN